MSFKILSDFDGVWTNPVHEAESVRELMIRETARLTGRDLAGVAADYEAFRLLAMAAPAANGWAPPRFTGGRITAFVDEDPFCAGNAIAGVLGDLSEAGGSNKTDGLDPELVARACEYAAAIGERGFGTGFESASDFADHAFLAATSAYRTEHPPALVDGAVDIARGLLEAGVELVIVSNSGTDKILDWFGAMGIPGHDAKQPAPAGEGASIAVRGGAGKFILGASDASIAVADRTIYVDRPSYLAVLEAEAPDLVIGDVFSLDLALPHVLRSAGAKGAPSELVLRRHDYTPAWVAGDRAGGAIDHVITDLAELGEIAAAHLAAD
ncbi:MAG: hypothetical protein P1V81_13345 [Planctomycetota bacterium]|nr:hypothetical protein [Planctomycetota bacterium]